MDREAVAALGDDELVAEGLARHGRIVAEQAELMALLGAMAARELWKRDGSVTMTDWVVATFNVPRATAADWVTLAGGLPELPALSAALSAGKVSLESAAAAASLADASSDAFFAAQAEELPVESLRSAARQAEALSARQASPTRRAPFRCWFDDEGWCRLTGWLAPEEGAAVMAAVNRARADEGPDPVTGQWEPAETQDAHALVALAATALAEDADADRATVVVHVGVADLVNGTGSGTLELGGSVPAAVVAKLACDGRLEAVLAGEAGTVGIGRASQIVPGWLRRQLKHRDGTCRFPGCSRRRHLHPHHIEHWVHGGPSDLTNLAMLCTAHHALMHEGGWHVEGNPEPGPGAASTLTFYRPDGTPYLPGATREACRPGGEPGEPEPAGRSPGGERGQPLPLFQPALT
jgi:hypothetical protein